MSQNQSSIFIKISNTKTSYSNFSYPLQCTFERNRYDPNTREYIVVDDLNVNLRQGSLTGGINLHLTSTARSERSYLLGVKIKDNHGIRFQAAQWLSLTRTDTVDVNNSQQLKTIYVEVVQNN